MRWASASGTGDDLDALLRRVIPEVAAGLAGEPAHAAFLFLGPRHAPRGASAAYTAVRAALGPIPVVGCSAGGVLGGGREHEQAGAMSLLAGSLPGVRVSRFRF